MLSLSNAYPGDGTSSRSITGLGFKPDIVLIKDVGNSNDTWFQTKDMPAGYAVPVRGDNAGATGIITSLDSDGFTVTSNSAVNANGAYYMYLALKDDGSSDFSTINYTGNNTDGLAVTLGWQPDFVLTKSASGITGAEKFAGQGTNGSTYAQASAIASMQFNGGADRTDLIQITSTGFLLGNGDNSGGNLVNVNATAHYGFALKNSTGLISAGTFTGNATSGRVITTGFLPIYAQVRKSTGDKPVNMYAGQSASGNAMGWDDTQATGYMTANSFVSNGFTLTASDSVNSNGVQFWYVALGAKAFTPPVVVSSTSSSTLMMMGV